MSDLESVASSDTRRKVFVYIVALRANQDALSGNTSADRNNNYPFFHFLDRPLVLDYYVFVSQPHTKESWYVEYFHHILDRRYDRPQQIQMINRDCIPAIYVYHRSFSTPCRSI